MRKLLVVTALGLVLGACQQADDKKANSESNKTSEAKTETSTSGKKVAEGEIQDSKQMAYAMGAQMANYLDKDMTQYKALEMDRAELIRGFTDGLQGKSLLDEQEIQSQVRIYQEKLRFAKKQEADKKTAERLEKGKAYLEANAKKPGVKTTASGLQYEVLEEGKDASKKPKATDVVKVHYTGTFIDGSKFDSSVDRGQPAEFPLNRVIKGWTEGLQLMSVGSKYKFTIPANLGYGPTDRGPIPGNSVLLFEVELLDIVTPEQAKKDAAR